nr:reverse transcriptase domain-containing protein [Tanacetum cinerariifolium]
MHTRRSYFPPNSTIHRRCKKQTTNVVEPEFRTIVTMADNRTMAQMLQAPIEGYEDAIVVPQINANNFELNQTLINLVQSNQFTGRQDPHNHLCFFNKVTSTFRHPEVPNTTIKLLLFPFSLKGEARIWLDKEPPRLILTWEDRVSKFINQFFPPSKTTYLQKEITNFLQKPNETFNEAWERFKDLLRQCPHHGFSELHQLDTFYNALNPNDQDALDSAAGGNFLVKIPRECLSIIESKSKVRYSRSRVTDVRANANAPLPTSSHSNSFDLQQIAASLEDKLDIRMNRFKKSLNDMKNSFITPTAPLKAVEENTITQGKFKAYTTANDANMNNLQLKSGMSYKEPPIPPPGVKQQEPIEETTDTELPSPKDIQPPLVQVEVHVDKPTEEPSVVIPKAKANLPFSSRLQKEKLREKDDILAAKFMEIFRDLHFELSFIDALVYMPKFTLMFKKLLNNKDKLIELTKTPLNKNYSAVVLKKLPEKLDFIVLDFVDDPSVPLILGRPFLSTAHAIINVYEREIIIRQNQQSLTIQCSDIPFVKKVEQINKIDFINAGGIDFELEEIEDFLNDDSISFGIEDSIPFIPIYILEEERTRREHADYINRMKMLFTINLRPPNSTNVESFSSFPIPNQVTEPHQEEIDVVSVTNDVLPPSDDDSDEEVDDIGDVRVDNVIQNSENEYSESEDSDLDNPPLPLQPSDKEFDFEKEISVVRNVIVKFNARVKFDAFNDENDALSYFMFVIFAKEFSILFVESEDTIFDPGISE